MRISGLLWILAFVCVCVLHPVLSAGLAESIDVIGKAMQNQNVSHICRGRALLVGSLGYFVTVQDGSVSAMPPLDHGSPIGSAIVRPYLAPFRSILHPYAGRYEFPSASFCAKT